MPPYREMRRLRDVRPCRAATLERRAALALPPGVRAKRTTSATLTTRSVLPMRAMRVTHLSP